MGSLYWCTPACTSLCQLFPFEFVEYVRNVSRLLQWRPQLGPATWPVCHTDFYFANNIEHKLKLMINIAVFCNIYCTYSTEVRTLHGQVVVSRDPPPLIWQHLISYPSLPYWIKYPPLTVYYKYDTSGDLSRGTTLLYLDWSGYNKVWNIILQTLTLLSN